MSAPLPAASFKPSLLCSSLVSRITPLALHCAASLGADRILDAGPVPLSKKTGMPTVRLNEADMENKPCAFFSFPHRTGKELVVSCFPLSMLTPEALSRHIDRVYCTAAVALFADFKLAERNIELPASLLMGGLRKLHRVKRNAFDSLGGIEGFLYAEKKRFRVLERHTLLGGSLSCILTERIAV